MLPVVLWLGTWLHSAVLCSWLWLVGLMELFPPSYSLECGWFVGRLDSDALLSLLFPTKSKRGLNFPEQWQESVARSPFYFSLFILHAIPEVSLALLLNDVWCFLWPCFQDSPISWMTLLLGMVHFKCFFLFRNVLAPFLGEDNFIVLITIICVHYKNSQIWERVPVSHIN